MVKAPDLCRECKGLGKNWNCEGVNEGKRCTCYRCTGNEECAVCLGTGYDESMEDL